MTKFCIICGKELIGRQRKLCSDEKCHREYHAKYERDRRQNEQKPKFCIICGKPLTGKQIKLCSNKECHRKRKNECHHNYRQNNPENDYKYRQEHRDEMNEYNHEYYQKNLEKIKEYGCRYRQDNPKKVKENIRRWRQNNPEKIKEYLQNNVEKLKENSRRYYQNNREEAQRYYQNNRDEILEYGRKKYRLSRGLLEDCDLRKESSLEKITRKWLQENNIEFIAQYYINLEGGNYTKVDFYIPDVNICLYVDGNYYHLLSNVKRCDADQNRILPQMGYDVIRITETEILEGNEVWYRLAQYLGIDKNEKDHA